MRTDIYFWYDGIHPDDRERVVASIHSVIENGGIEWAADYRFRVATGSYRHVRDRGDVVRDEIGAPKRMVGAMVDITQQKKMEEERYGLLRQEREAFARAERALRAQDDVLSVISHDLKNPLSSILMNVALAKKITESTDHFSRLPKMLERIHEGAERMKVMIADLVDLAHAEAGTLLIHADSVELGEFIRQLTLETKDTRLIIENLDSGVRLMVDRDRAAQVFLKVFQFFERRDPALPTLRLRSDLLEDQVAFQVIDPLLVLGEEAFSHVFERRGSDMDLSIAREVIRAHGGRMWITSHPDRGTVLNFTLGVAKQERHSEAA
jgi:signal transduction histidine kinase